MFQVNPLLSGGIHEKNQAFFSSEDKSEKKKKCRLLQFYFAALSVKLQKQQLNQLSSLY